MGLVTWTVGKVGRAVGHTIGYVKNTSRAKLALDAFNIWSIGGDLVDAITGTEGTSESASTEIPVMTEEQMNNTFAAKEKPKADQLTSGFTKVGSSTTLKNPAITLDPDSRTLNGSSDATTQVKSEISNHEVVNSAITKLLANVDLDDFDNNPDTMAMYDLYFIPTIREIVLKRYPTIRNYQNAYSFSAMLKEKQEEQTFEEIVLILFYFRMV